MSFVSSRALAQDDTDAETPPKAQEAAAAEPTPAPAAEATKPAAEPVTAPAEAPPKPKFGDTTTHG